MDYRPQRSSSAVVVGIDGGAGERKGRVERHGRTSFVYHDKNNTRATIANMDLVLYKSGDNRGALYSAWAHNLRDDLRRRSRSRLQVR